MAVTNSQPQGKAFVKSIATYEDVDRELQHATEHHKFLPTYNDEDLSKYLSVDKTIPFESKALEKISGDRLRNAVIDAFLETEEHRTIRSQKSVWEAIKGSLHVVQSSEIFLQAIRAPEEPETNGWDTVELEDGTFMKWWPDFDENSE